jgi:predicted DNA-binding transcriptional regulator YafY
MAGLDLENKVRMNRILTIDEAVRSGKYPNSYNLASLTEVNPRTIQRDIEYMKDIFNAPLEYDASHRGYYYTEPNFFIKSVPLSEGELFSIALFDQLLEQYRNTPLEGNLRKIFSKIVQCLPDNVSVDANFLTTQMSFIPDHAGKIDLKVFKLIFQALKLRNTITFEYRPLAKTTHMKRTVDPYHAICQKGNWYIIGFCHDKQEPRLFSFSRMQNITITKKVFSIPEDFNPNEYFDKEMGVWASARTPKTIELVFDKDIGTFALDRQWHSSQEVKANDDGSVYVKFTTTQMPEVFRWVMGQGHTVKVLGPDDLVVMVKEEAVSMLGMYG